METKNNSFYFKTQKAGNREIFLENLI